MQHNLPLILPMPTIENGSLANATVPNVTCGTIVSDQNTSLNKTLKAQIFLGAARRKIRI